MLKKYFYVLRPLLAAKWIMDKNTIPPIQFQELMNAELDKELLPDVTRLLQMKRESSEMGVGQRIQSIHDYAERTMVEINNAIEHIGFETEKDWGPLDDLFLKFVN